jgi:hypothetical protein
VDVITGQELLLPWVVEKEMDTDFSSSTNCHPSTFWEVALVIDG